MPARTCTRRRVLMGAAHNAKLPQVGCLPRVRVPPAAYKPHAFRRARCVVQGPRMRPPAWGWRWRWRACMRLTRAARWPHRSSCCSTAARRPSCRRATLLWYAMLRRSQVLRCHCRTMDGGETFLQARHLVMPCHAARRLYIIIDGACDGSGARGGLPDRPALPAELPCRRCAWKHAGDAAALP